MSKGEPSGPSPQASAFGTTLDAPLRPAGDPRAIRRVLGGRYEVRGVLGQGGMGEVWLARDLKLQVDVALKVVRPDKVGDAEALARLRAEVRAAREVASPHVCRVYDLVEADGLECISMEYVDGTTLRQVLCADRQLDLNEAREYALQLLAGLGAIHEAGLVHRDVKPENIMITRAGRVVLMDFGVAKSAATRGTIAGTPTYWAPEQAEGAPADPRADVFSVGLVLAELVAPSGMRKPGEVQALMAGLRCEPPRVPESPWSDAIRKAVARDPRERYSTAEALARALEEIAERGSPTTREKAKPYPGLATFTEADAAYFFGREAEVEEAWKRLSNRHLLALVGPSGAGKSSFLRAGLIPAAPEGWAHLVCTPGDAPFIALGQALVPAIARDTDAMRRMLRFEDADVAVDLFRRWRASHEEVLVVVDQFEELFTLNPPEGQARFALLLSRLVLEADVHVFLAMRDDFLVRCREHEALRPVFSDLLPLGAPAGESLRRALVQPALKCGYRFEDEALVATMLQAVEGERAALPLLAFAAGSLWDRRDRERGLLTRAAHDAVGGVAGGLVRHADATLERIGPAGLPLARELFRNLVTAEGTRAVRDVDELLTLFPAGERANAAGVLDALIDARLVTAYDAHGAEPGQKAGRRVELVHESLLTAWPRLVRWRTEDEAGAELRDQLRQAAHLWREKGRTVDLLWTGTAYQEFRLWRQRYPGALTELEEGFAKAMTNKARRKKRLVRAASAAVVLVSVGVAIAIGVSRHKAVVAAQRAEASKLLSLAQLKLQEDPTEALAYATASLDVTDTKEARLFVLRALQNSPPAWEVESGEGGEAWYPAFSPDGRQLAAAGYPSTVGIWDESGGQPLQLPGHETGGYGNVARWASAELLVTGIGFGRLTHVWAMPAGRKLRTIDFGAPSRWQVGSGRLFAETPEPTPGKQSTGSLLLRSWRLPDGETEVLGRVDAGRLGATAGLFDPLGRAWLHAKGKTTTLVPLPVGREKEQVFSEHSANVSLRFIESGVAGLHDDSGENRLLYFTENGPAVLKIVRKPASAPSEVFCTRSARWLIGRPPKDTRVRLWDTSALPGARPLELRREGPWHLAGTSVNAAGRVVVASTHGGTRQTFWPLPDRTGNVVDGYESMGKPTAFSPDGKWLATNWADGRLRLWPLPGSGSTEVRVLNAPPAPRAALAFDPGGRFVFSTGGEDSAWIVPVDGSPGRKLDEYSRDTVLASAAISPTGRRVATAFWSGKGSRTLRVWDVETGKVRLFDLPASPAAPSGYEGGVFSISFLDESTLVTGGDGGIRRWNLDTGANEVIRPVASDLGMTMDVTSDRREIIFCEGDEKRTARSVSCGVIDIATRVERPLDGSFEAGTNVPTANLDFGFATQGSVVALTGTDLSIRVGLRSGGEPHWLLGHTGALYRVAISPDLKWVASSGEDNTLRLWPMPDLSKPPLHTLPHGELLAKLRSLTNLRAVRDPASENGWKIELGPFPGWKNLPEWPP